MLGVLSGGFGVDVMFEVVRQRSGDFPKKQMFTLADVAPQTTILDCLNRIKWEQDGSLGFRKNCRNTICGSCGIRMNGRSGLACKEKVGETLKSFPERSHNGTPVIAIAPLGNLPVMKDLIVDMSAFWDNLEAVDPYVSTAARQSQFPTPTDAPQTDAPQKETLQTPAERAKLAAAGNCILCGACYSECNAREVNSTFVGPHALAKAQRILDDTRDEATAERLERYGEDLSGVWGCTRCYQCNEVCPMEVQPLDRISAIKAQVLEEQAAIATTNVSRPVRHRRVLRELVREGGWIDERQFALRVVGNAFRDWAGLASLGPLGLRLLAKGKVPLGFEPPEGVDEIQGVMDAVRSLEAKGVVAPR